MGTGSPFSGDWGGG
jgi:hypothetical protein